MNSDTLAGKLISKFGASLETICITNVEEWDWLSSLCGLPNLRSMYIKCNYRYDDVEVISSGPCKSMRRLKIEAIGSRVFPNLNTFISATFPELVYLKVEYFSGNFTLKNLPMLKYLEMYTYNELDDLLLQDFKTLPSLRSIKLTGRRWECQYYDSSMNNPQIKEVVLSAEDPLDDVDLLQMTKVFPAMTSFSWRAWAFCSQAGIDAARKVLPNCHFDVEPDVDADSLAVGSEPGDSGTDSDTDSESS